MRDWDKIEDLVDFITEPEETVHLYGDYIRDKREYTSLEAKMEEIAEKVISRIDENVVAEFDFSDESLESLENIISEGFITSEESPDEEVLEDIVMDLGSYLGLTIINSLGGEWRFRSDYMHSSVYFPAIDAECFPFHRVARRVTGGRKESLSDFYLSLIQVLGVDD